MTETMKVIVIETMKDSIGLGTTQNQDSIAIMVVSTIGVMEDSMALLEIIGAIHHGVIGMATMVKSLL